jgi:hypothetical protein
MNPEELTESPIFDELAIERLRVALENWGQTHDVEL